MRSSLTAEGAACLPFPKLGMVRRPGSSRWLHLDAASAEGFYGATRMGRFRLARTTHGGTNRTMHPCCWAMQAFVGCTSVDGAHPTCCNLGIPSEAVPFILSFFILAGLEGAGPGGGIFRRRHGQHILIKEGLLVLECHDA